MRVLVHIIKLNQYYVPETIDLRIVQKKEKRIASTAG